MTYVMKEEDLDSTAGGIVSKVLKGRLGLYAHEISSAKFYPMGIAVKKAEKIWGADLNGIKDSISKEGWTSVTVKERLRPGDILRIILPDGGGDGDKGILSVAGDIRVLYEDPDLVALDKPAGVVCHPSHGHYRDSLANYLCFYLEQKGEGGVSHAIGRLDKDTSGIVVFAKNKAAASRLFRQKDEGQFRKRYLAIVMGNPELDPGRFRAVLESGDRERAGHAAFEAFFEDSAEGGWKVIDAPIGPVPGTLMKQQVVEPPLGKEALTWFRVISPGRNYSLIEVEIETGRTHQIRVHMAWIGHPLLGDSMYGGISLPEQGACGGRDLERGSMCVDQSLPEGHVYGGISLPEQAARGGLDLERGAVSEEGSLEGGTVYGARSLEGDSLYGDRHLERNSVCAAGSLQENSPCGGLRADRALLHAWKARLIQPFEHGEIYLESQLPEDMNLLSNFL